MIRYFLKKEGTFSPKYGIMDKDRKTVPIINIASRIPIHRQAETGEVG